MVRDQKQESQPHRIPRTDLFYGIAELYGKRSTCPRAQVGAVAVREGRVVAAGYNGAPAGHKHCTEVGCELHYTYIGEGAPDAWALKDGRVEIGVTPEDSEEHCTRSVHAEANLVSWAAREGIRLRGTQIYLTHTPCEHCSKLLINAGVEEVRILNQYGHEGGTKLLFASDILVFYAASS